MENCEGVVLRLLPLHSILLVPSLALGPSCDVLSLKRGLHC